MSLQGLLKNLDPVKAGLYVITKEDLELIHKILKKALFDIASVCKDNGIDWLLSGGSMLGAVRHGGFIPWDDDIDIFMTRKNFESFRKIFQGTLSDHYVLKVPGDSGYLMHYPQIHVKGTTTQSIQSDGKTQEGLFIDVFILESTYNNTFLRWLHGCLCNGFLAIDSAVRTKRCKTMLLRYDDGSGRIRKEVRKRCFVAVFCGFMDLEKWLALSDRVFSSCKKEARFVACPSGVLHFFGETFLRGKLCTTKEVPFEDITAFVPVDYDYYLTLRYGKSYMTPPPMEKREKHAYVRFEVTEEVRNLAEQGSLS